jgi:chitinase
MYLCQHSIQGNLENLKSFDEPHVHFRIKGKVDTSLNFEASAQLTFTTSRMELFGVHNFGATFRVPGLVTIGPNCRVSFRKSFRL